DIIWYRRARQDVGHDPWILAAGVDCHPVSCWKCTVCAVCCRAERRELVSVSFRYTAAPATGPLPAFRNRARGCATGVADRRESRRIVVTRRSKVVRSPGARTPRKAGRFSRSAEAGSKVLFKGVQKLLAA